MPNDKYIKLSEAINLVMEWCPDDDGSVGKTGDLREMLDELESIPAADVAPVVRCKDCKHRDPEDHKCDSGRLERAGCIFAVDDDYFCADGERKEEEDE